MSAHAEMMNDMVFSSVQKAIDDDMNMWHHDAMLWDANAANAANALIIRYQNIQQRQSKLDMYRCTCFAQKSKNTTDMTDQAHQAYQNFVNDLTNINDHERRLLELENINDLTRDELLELVRVTRSRMIRDQILTADDEDYRPYEPPKCYDSCAVATFYRLNQKVVELERAVVEQKRHCE